LAIPFIVVAYILLSMADNLWLSKD